MCWQAYQTFIYMDDILVYSKDETSHMATLEEVFRKLREAGLAISLKKCLFGADTLEFVGYMVNKDGITPLKRKIDAITSFPSPQEQKNFLGFLGPVQQAMRNFLPEFNGRHLIVFTDHKALLGAFKHPTSQAYDPIAENHINEIAQ